jgi:hypothetical protein
MPFDWLAGSKLGVDLAQKLYEYCKGKGDEETMENIVNEMRLRTYTHDGGNAIATTVGSEADRFLGRMATKGLLVRLPFGGYMLPDTINKASGWFD